MSRKTSKKRAKTKRRQRGGALRGPRIAVHRGGVWEIGSVPVAGSADPLGLYEILLVVDARERLFLAVDVALRPIEADAVQELVERAANSPIVPGPTACPRVLQVDSEQMAHWLEHFAAGLGCSVVVRDRLPVLSELGSQVTQDMPPVYSPDFVGAEHLQAELCAAAERIAEIAPWRLLLHEEAITIDVAGEPLSHPVAIVLGAAGTVEGVSLFRSQAELYRCGEEVDELGGPGTAWDTVTLLFDRSPEVEEPVRQAYAGLGYGRTDRYPSFVRVRPGQEHRSLNKSEATTMRLALASLATFFEEHRSALLARSRSLTGTYDDTVSRRAVTVRVSPRDDEDPRLDQLGSVERGVPPTNTELEWLGPPGELVTSFVALDHEFLSAAAASSFFPPPWFDLLELSELPDPVPALIIKTRKPGAIATAGRLRNMDGLAVVEAEPKGGEPLLIVAFEDQRPSGVLAVIASSEEAMAARQRFIELAIGSGGQIVLVISAGGARRSQHRVKASEVVVAKTVRLVGTPATESSAKTQARD